MMDFKVGDYVRVSDNWKQSFPMLAATYEAGDPSIGLVTQIEPNVLSPQERFSVIICWFTGWRKRRQLIGGRSCSSVCHASSMLSKVDDDECVLYTLSEG
jgi:hypothetical protein